MVKHISGLLPAKVFYVALSIIVGVFLAIGGSLVSLSKTKLEKEIYYNYEERAEQRHIRVMGKLGELQVTLASHSK